MTLVFRALLLSSGGCGEVTTFLSRKRFLCRQKEKISFLRFSIGFSVNILYFSSKQRQQTFLFGFSCFIIFHSILYSAFLFFRLQISSLKDVFDFLCSSCQNDLCRFNLVLHNFSVSPIEVSCLFVPYSVIVAL